jgi:hypothetical protein
MHNYRTQSTLGIIIIPHSALSTVTANNFEPLNGGIQQSK